MIEAMPMSSTLRIKASTMGFGNYRLDTQLVFGVDFGLVTTYGQLMLSVSLILAFLHTYKISWLFQLMLSACKRQLDPSISRSDLTTRCRHVDLGDTQPTL